MKILDNNKNFEDKKVVFSDFLFYSNRYPDNTALVVNGESWSYREVENTAQQWATSLLRFIAKPKRIGLFSERSKVSYIGLLAILFSGATIVPLNKNFPVERTKNMIEQADLDAIIVDKSSMKQFQLIFDSSKKMPELILLPESEKKSLDCNDLNIIDINDIKNYQYINEFVYPNENKVAYLLFTSGSTGEPKGVPINHSNILHFLEVNKRKYNFNIHDRFTQIFDHTFDLFMFDLFMPLSVGASLYVLKPIELIYPLNFIKKNNITVWFSVPSLVSLLRKQNLLDNETLPSLRYSFFCGEPLTNSSATEWSKVAYNSTIENMYGPTELTIACTSFTWKQEDVPTNASLVPIGTIFPGLDAVIIDDNSQSVGPNVKGELCISGPQTFTGYWKNLEMTESKFVYLKDRSGELKKYYKTGDIVIKDENEVMNFIGRIDQQIKINGFRVEIGEIEEVISRISKVISVAIVPSFDIATNTTKKLVAFIVSKNLSEKEVLDYISNYLPKYMHPSELIFLSRMPFNSNGKVNKKELLLMVQEQPYTTSYV